MFEEKRIRFIKDRDKAAIENNVLQSNINQIVKEKGILERVIKFKNKGIVLPICCLLCFAGATILSWLHLIYGTIMMWVMYGTGLVLLVSYKKSWSKLDNIPKIKTFLSKSNKELKKLLKDQKVKIKSLEKNININEHTIDRVERELSLLNETERVIGMSNSEESIIQMELEDSLLGKKIRELRKLKDEYQASPNSDIKNYRKEKNKN